MEALELAVAVLTPGPAGTASRLRMSSLNVVADAGQSVLGYAAWRPFALCRAQSRLMPTGQSKKQQVVPEKRAAGEREAQGGGPVERHGSAQHHNKPKPKARSARPMGGAIKRKTKPTIIRTTPNRG